MNGRLSMKFGVPRITWMNGNGCVSEHCFDTSGCNDNFIVFTSFNLVGKVNEYSKLYFLLIAGNGEESSSRNFHLFHFNVRNGRFEGAAPVDEAIGSIN